MKDISLIIKNFIGICAIVLLAFACSEDEQIFERTRLFRPVLNKPLEAIGNTIKVNMADMKAAKSYAIEVSRDTFKTVDYRFTVDTTTFVIDESLTGEELYWNTIYQVRATAHADDAQYNSRKSDLGSVRTQRFPSNMYMPSINDVLDTRAKVRWQPIGDPIDEIKVFSANDPKLERPIIIFKVSAEENAAGQKIVTNLLPLTAYQIAIFSDGQVRGWENFTTIKSIVDKNSPNVIDLSGSIDPEAVSEAYAMANEGDTILLKKGVVYNFPGQDADKSITFVGDLGFEAQKAGLFTTGSWDVVEGSLIDHIRFIDLELFGEDWGGDYIMNPSGFTTETRINEFTIDNCLVHDFRGIMRIRNKMFVDNYNILNSIVHTIGGYGILTADTDGAGNAAFGNIRLINSTFSNIIIGIQTRQNVQSITIDGVTFYNFPEKGRQIFRFRGADGFDEAINGVAISNSIFGHAWDPSGSGSYEINAVDGLTETNIVVTNTYATSQFAVSAGNEIPGLPSTVYSGTDEQLWVDPDNLDFNFEDTGFGGRTSTGDPRWRAEF